jgi:tetratricopeptide (TPR) repeat protein
MKKKIMFFSIFIIITLGLSLAAMGGDEEGVYAGSSWCPICKANFPPSHYHFHQSRSHGNNNDGGVLGALFKSIFSSGRSQAPQQTRGDRGDELNGIGVDLYNRGDFNGAESYFKKALRMNPKNQVIRRNIANSLNAKGLDALKKGELSKAARLFEDALEYDPESQIIQRNLAADLAGMAKEADDKGDKRQAEMLLARALNYDPGNQEMEAGLRYLRDYLGDQERLEGTRKTLTKMLDRLSSELEQANSSASAAVVDLTFLDPNKPILVDLNVVKGKPRRIPVQPGSSTPKGKSYDLGFDKLRQFDPTAAVELFKQAEIENPDNPLVRNAMDLARDLVKVHKDEAMAKAEQDNFITARVTYLAGLIALRDGDLAAAGDILSRAIQANPADADLVTASDSMRRYLYWAKKAQPDNAIPGDRYAEIHAKMLGHSSNAMLAMTVRNYQDALNELNTAEVLFDDFEEKTQWVFDENELMMRKELGDASQQAKRLLSERGK